MLLRSTLWVERRPTSFGSLIALPERVADLAKKGGARSQLPLDQKLDLTPAHPSPGRGIKFGQAIESGLPFHLG
jgi:hypothetical protein